MYTTNTVPLAIPDKVYCDKYVKLTARVCVRDRHRWKRRRLPTLLPTGIQRLRIASHVQPLHRDAENKRHDRVGLHLEYKRNRWLKEPGTNRRVKRAREPSELIVVDQPDLAIVDRETWDAVQ